MRSGPFQFLHWVFSPTRRVQHGTRLERSSGRIIALSDICPAASNHWTSLTKSVFPLGIQGIFACFIIPKHAHYFSFATKVDRHVRLVPAMAFWTRHSKLLPFSSRLINGKGNLLFAGRTTKARRSTPPHVATVHSDQSLRWQLRFSTGWKVSAGSQVDPQLWPVHVGVLDRRLFAWQLQFVPPATCLPRWELRPRSLAFPPPNPHRQIAVGSCGEPRRFVGGCSEPAAVAWPHGRAGSPV